MIFRKTVSLLFVCFSFFAAQASPKGKNELLERLRNFLRPPIMSAEDLKRQQNTLLQVSAEDEQQAYGYRILNGCAADIERIYEKILECEINTNEENLQAEENAKPFRLAASSASQEAVENTEPLQAKLQNMNNIVGKTLALVTKYREEKKGISIKQQACLDGLIQNIQTCPGVIEDWCNRES